MFHEAKGKAFCANNADKGEDRVLHKIADTCLEANVYVLHDFHPRNVSKTYRPDSYQTQRTSPPSDSAESSRCGLCCCETAPDISA